jgi:hypothetical protein
MRKTEHGNRLGRPALAALAAMSVDGTPQDVPALTGTATTPCIGAAPVSRRWPKPPREYTVALSLIVANCGQWCSKP